MNTETNVDQNSGQNEEARAVADAIIGLLTYAERHELSDYGIGIATCALLFTSHNDDTRDMLLQSIGVFVNIKQRNNVRSLGGIESYIRNGFISQAEFDAAQERLHKAAMEASKASKETGND